MVVTGGVLAPISDYGAASLPRCAEARMLMATLTEHFFGVNDDRGNSADGDTARHRLPPHELIGLVLAHVAFGHQDRLGPLDASDRTQRLVELLDAAAQALVVGEMRTGQDQAGEHGMRR